jgi:four helix bundle protein
MFGGLVQESRSMATGNTDDRRRLQADRRVPIVRAIWPPNQLRRASVSVTSNITEGYGRSATGEYLQFLGIARGSNCEVQTQLVLSAELNFGKEGNRAVANGLSEEVSRMLVAMMKKLHE